MSQIYSTASEVIVWPGHPTEGSHFMLRCMKMATVAQDDIPRFICSVTKFCQRPWFERTWVVQEVVLSRNEPQLFCGLSSFSWYQLCEPLAILYQRFFQRERVSGDDHFPSVYKDSLDDFDAWKLLFSYDDHHKVLEEKTAALNDFFDAVDAVRRVRGMRDSGPFGSFPS